MRRSRRYAADGIGGIASAILDRLLHRSEAIVVKGRSYRMKDVVEPAA
jgi:DNA replication protein DnaC